MDAMSIHYVKIESAIWMYVVYRLRVLITYHVRLECRLCMLCALDLECMLTIQADT